MVTEFGEPFIGKLPNEFDMGLDRRAGHVLIEALVRITLVRLRILSTPCHDLVFVDDDLAVLYPSFELR